MCRRSFFPFVIFSMKSNANYACLSMKNGIKLMKTNKFRGSFVLIRALTVENISDI